MDQTLAAADASSITTTPRKVSDPSIPPAGPPIGNFPLPRELRDHIYSYLLDAEQVIAPPYVEKQEEDTEAHARCFSYAHTYDFQTSILAVNKEIHNEAKDVFIKNCFVRVEVQWPEVAEDLHYYDVPIVSEDQGQLENAAPSHSLALRVKPSKIDDTTNIDVWMVAWRDFSSFHRLLQWLAWKLPLPLSLTVEKGDETWSFSNTSDEHLQSITTEIWFSDFLRSQKISEMCTALNDFTVPGQEVVVHIKGQHNEKMSDGMTTLMGGQERDAAQHMLHLFSNVMSIKDLAEAFVHDSNFGIANALLHYQLLYNALGKWPSFRMCLKEPELLFKTKDTLVLMFLLLIDTSNTALALTLRLRGPDHCELPEGFLDAGNRALKALLDTPGLFDDAEPFKAATSHYPTISTMLRTRAPQAVDTIRPLLSALSAIGDDEYLKHDVKVLNRIAAEEELRKMLAEGDPTLSDLFSWSQLPIRTFTSPIFPLITAARDLRIAGENEG